MKLLAVCTGTAQPIAAKSGRTGHFKTPQLGAVHIGPTGLAGDQIVDVAHHGGPEQAVYLFGEADRLWWQTTLGTPLPAGYFGENLTLDGIASDDLALGDILEVGAVRLQITAPRIPCVTFNARTGRKDGIDLFYQSRRPGAYARVLRAGDVTAWDPVAHQPFDGPRISVAAHLDAFRNRRNDPTYWAPLRDVPAHAQIVEMAHQIVAGHA